MSAGDQKIGVDDILGTADVIDKAVDDLRQAQSRANTKSQDLVGGAWSTPKASAKFHQEWTDWNTHMNKMLEIGPDFSKWLRNYARDAEQLDSAYAK